MPTVLRHLNLVSIDNEIVTVNQPLDRMTSTSREIHIYFHELDASSFKWTALVLFLSLAFVSYRVRSKEQKVTPSRSFPTVSANRASNMPSPTTVKAVPSIGKVTVSKILIHPIKVRGDHIAFLLEKYLNGSLMPPTFLW